ncbi:MAG: hypothetical protein P8X57_10780 [Cyclobacteriaceae bacterium]
MSENSSFGVKSLSGDTIRLNLLSLSDSRCPSDVTCIRAGEYSADIEMILNPDTTYINLCRGDCNQFDKDSALAIINNKEYWVRMDDLTPYPSTDNPNPDYKLKLTVLEVN